MDVPLGKGCLGHPHSKETGMTRGVDLFREEKMELQDLGSLHWVAPASLEPRGAQLRTGSCGSVPCSLPVGSKGFSASLMTRLLWLAPLPLSLGCRVQLNAPLVLGSLDCWSEAGGGIRKILLFR